jgi:hypothetical protein
MDLESIVGGTAVHGAATIPAEDMTSQSAGNDPAATTQVERLTGFGHADHFDIPVTEDLF